VSYCDSLRQKILLAANAAAESIWTRHYTTANIAAGHDMGLSLLDFTQLFSKSTQKSLYAPARKQNLIAIVQTAMVDEDTSSLQGTRGSALRQWDFSIPLA